MNKSYLVLVDGKLWSRKLTEAGAKKLILFLLETRGIKAQLAYAFEGRFNNVHN